MELFFDTETSGMVNFRAHYADPSQPWVVQLAAVLSDRERVYASMNLLVRPDGRTMEPSAAAIHGIEDAWLLTAGVPEHLAAFAFFTLASRSELLVAHNLDFDRTMMLGMLGRQMSAGDLQAVEAMRGFCTMKRSTNLCAIPGGRGYKWPKLQELHEKLFGEGFEDAHDAMVDVMACRRCYYALPDEVRQT